MTWAETYGQGPGQVENYLSWIGADRSGTRGEALSRASPGTIQISGEVDVLRNLSSIVYRVHDAALARLKANVEYGMSLSKHQAPWESTHMIQTATIEEVPEIDGFEAGYNTPYAGRQHEDMTLHHPKPGTKAKFLEDPFMELAPTIADDIAEYLKGVLG